MKKILLLLAFIIALPIQAYAASPREVQYAHALSRAISRDPSIVPLDRESREAAANARQLLTEYFAIVNIDRAAGEALYGQRLMAIAESERLQRERQRLVLAAERNLRSHLANIAGHKSNQAVLEMTLTLQENTLEQTKLRLEHGMASEVDVREAELTAEQTRLNLESLNLALENERQSLNRLIHQPITANIQVIYDIGDYDPLPENIDHFVRFNIARDHTILYWQGQADVRRHEWQRQLDDPAVDNRYMRLQHQLAVLERNMAERMAEQNIRGALAEWERLQEVQIALEAELEQARADYLDMQVRLEAGLVTQLAVDGMAVAYAAAEASLNRHAYDLWIARLRLEHPYAL